MRFIVIGPKSLQTGKRSKLRDKINNEINILNKCSTYYIDEFIRINIIRVWNRIRVKSFYLNNHKYLRICVLYFTDLIFIKQFKYLYWISFEVYLDM